MSVYERTCSYGGTVVIVVLVFTAIALAAMDEGIYNCW